MSMTTMFWSKITFGAVLVGLTLLTSANVIAAGLTQAFDSDDSGIREGMAIALNNQGKVQRAGQEDTSRFIGIAVPADGNVATVAARGQHVFVQPDGEVRAYISDINGSVSKGDVLAVSPLRGVLMKAGNETLGKIAVAVEGFDQARSTEEVQVDGRNVRLGLIEVSLDYKPGSAEAVRDNQNILRTIGQAIAGKDVSTAQVVAALVVLVTVLAIEGSVIYGVMSSTIIATGRNPMAHQTIHKESRRAVWTAAVVVLLGIISAYIILLI